jgi:hypothetical protein
MDDLIALLNHPAPLWLVLLVAVIAIKADIHAAR